MPFSLDLLICFIIFALGTFGYRKIIRPLRLNATARKLLSSQKAVIALPAKDFVLAEELSFLLQRWGIICISSGMTPNEWKAAYDTFAKREHYPFSHEKFSDADFIIAGQVSESSHKVGSPTMDHTREFLQWASIKHPRSILGGGFMESDAPIYCVSPEGKRMDANAVYAQYKNETNNNAKAPWQMMGYDLAFNFRVTLPQGRKDFVVAISASYNDRGTYRTLAKKAAETIVTAFQANSFVSNDLSELRSELHQPKEITT